MRAFVIRPFNIKSDIDFENVHKKLIGPALSKLQIEGSTTTPFLQAGNIRLDMFQQLLVADLVVADISIHNANVFYELGIRHALQPRRTFLIRAKQDDVPFDLLTDRYLEYQADKPEASLDQLVDGLRQTLASEDKADSPVFRMLPNLEAQDRSRFLPVPQTFQAEVEAATANKQVGRLGLLLMETQGLPWESEALRNVGRAQFKLKAYKAAKITWEKLLRIHDDTEANQKLGTIYQKLGDPDASDRVLQRALSDADLPDSERAEITSLLASNIKTRWRLAWSGMEGLEAQTAALSNPALLHACEMYKQGYQEDLNSYYSGINALSLLTLTLELARKLPEVWSARFDSDQESQLRLDSLERERQMLLGAMSSTLEATRRRLQLKGKHDRWCEITSADYVFLSSPKPEKVKFAYKTAIEGASIFEIDSAQAQLRLFRDLQIFPEKVASALAAFPQVTVPSSEPPARVIVFSGHMIDEPQAPAARFPNSLSAAAKEAIRNVVARQKSFTTGSVTAVAGGACGGDLLFLEVCDELGIPAKMFLPLMPDSFSNTAVNYAGPEWQDRFRRFISKLKPTCFAETDELPLWLTTRKDYTSWQRANLWLLQEALALQSQEISLIALWDGVEKPGFGGVSYMIAKSKEYGALVEEIPIAHLSTVNSPNPVTPP